MQKLLTIVVPAYNVAAYLERGLNTYCDTRLSKDLEIIVVNDGSTDETPAIAERFVERMPEVFRLISQENDGHGAAVMTGLAHANGRYFRVVDGDDWVNTEGLLELLETLRAVDTDLLIDCKREIDMVSGESRFFPRADTLPHNKVLPMASVLTDKRLIPQIMIHTLTCKTSYLRAQQIELLRHTFYEDYEYVLKATSPARTIVLLDTEVYQYLVGNVNQSVSRASYVARWEDHTRVVNELLRYYERTVFHENHEKTGLNQALEAYLVMRLCSLIRSHYNIALLFDDDRRRGRDRARAFRTRLKSEYPHLWKLTERRYLAALVLHRMRISFDTIERLRAMRRR
ncbi:glycosyltransferase family 2 protein [Collinsella sp. zg1085]|nr:glycosyltransferase family 2 protein [Collinsella sp. zg1085]